MTVVSSRGCLGLEASVGLGRLITGLEGSPPRSCLRRRAPLDLLALASFLFVGGWFDQTGSGGGAIWAIAQMKPTISRAMAVVATDHSAYMGSREQGFAPDRCRLGRSASS